ncbi:MAG: endo alpha-1,4 polygalactosaminidase [Gammaproteobacteria bacterium]|nr:endo alpha-1,4 polygalactosaminidase [Gammaproteobacteria bacterium]
MRNLVLNLVVLVGLVLSSCTTVQTQVTEPVYEQERWVVIPLHNKTVSSSAGDNAARMLETHLRARGITNIDQISGISSEEELTPAQRRKYRYAVLGEVSRWRSGSPVEQKSELALSMKIVDLPTQKVVWSGDIQQTSRDSFSRLADSAFKSLAANIQLRPGMAQAPHNNEFEIATLETSSTSPVVNAALPVATALGVTSNEVSETVVDRGNIVGKSVALFYGAKPSINVWSQFDRLVLEPDNIEPKEIEALKRSGTELFAYLSVGEVGPTRSYGAQIDPAWIMGKNPAWNSWVMDLSVQGWVEFLLEQVDRLSSQGYDGLFLDTLDSYQLHATTAQARELQQRGLVAFVSQVKKRHSHIQLIANRGFEVLPKIGNHLDALAAESLYSSWNNETSSYRPVSNNDRRWLLDTLNAAKNTYGFDVIAIDYVDPGHKSQSVSVARKIAEHGFIPWVSNPALDAVGVGSLEVMPREVLLLFDSKNSGTQAVSEVHRFIATPLEYKGYVPVYHDVATSGLPEKFAAGELAGIVTWANSTYSVEGVREFLLMSMRAGTPVAMLGVPGFSLNTDFSEQLGVHSITPIDLETTGVEQSSALVGFERSLPPRIDQLGIHARSKSDTNTVHLSLSDNNQNRADLVVTGPWGGLALYPATVDVDVNNVAYWVIDPYEFLTQALKLRTLPMPDVTTENGKRLWFSHIDGDALPSWAEIPGKKLGAEVIQEQFLTRYDYPHTVSVVEAEMKNLPQYADRQARMKTTMRSIFSMPNVELASHSFSHPYDWHKVSRWPKSGQYNLPVEGYRYNVDREIAGSVGFINSELAPKDKKVEVFLWSGEAVATERALAVTQEIGIANLNGGNTVISSLTPTLTTVSPMALTSGNYVQALAPIMNENVYTNNWKGPFDGFRRVIETMELTDKPRRLKPMNIYYHFYAGTKAASIQSLEEIYDWAVDEDPFPIYASEYAIKVPDFRSAGVARYLDGSWKLNGLGSIRSLRILDSTAWPDLVNSKGIVGAKRLHDGVYIHSDGSDTVLFKTQRTKPWSPYLVTANAKVENWDSLGSTVRFRLSGHQPVVLEIGGLTVAGCSISSSKETVQAIRLTDSTYRFEFKSKDTGDAVLNCPA